MKRLVVTRYEHTTAYPVACPITVAQVSDLHARRADDILDRLREEAPDLIVITGDTLERYDNRPQYDFKHKPLKRLIINAIHYTNWLLTKLRGRENQAHTAYAYDFLSKAVAVAPVYMSLGNHEQLLLESDYVFLSEHGVHLLDNACERVAVKGFEMLVGGMSSWDFEDFLVRFAGMSGFRLLLCHHPERFEPYIADTDIDLTLSGHTHGGQMRMGKRGRGFFVPGQGLFGRLAHGRFFGGRLIVCAGCSNTAAVPRVCNPRELVIVELKGKDHGTL